MSISTNAAVNFKTACKDLRREESDLLNRLKSISIDFEWLEELLEFATDESNKKYPIVANLRCGAWYYPPSKLHATSHYKSTDGHYGTWAFSMSRLNLNIIKLLEEHTAVCIIDSTRKGKLFPDAMIRTIPIWAAVLNRLKSHIVGDVQQKEFPYCSPSELSQICCKINKFVKDALDSGVIWDDVILKKTIEIRYISHETNSPISVFASANPDAHTIFCISVSSPTPKYRPSFTYIQGAGDDHQAWSNGLEPSGFWKFKNELLLLDNIACAELADKISKEHRDQNRSSFCKEENISDNIILGAHTISISASSVCRMSGIHFMSEMPSDELKISNLVFDGKFQTTSGGYLCCVVRSDSKKDFEKAAPFIIDFAREWFKINETLPISCQSGTDCSVAAAVLIISGLSSSGWELDFLPPSEISKHRLRGVLSRLTTYVPGASPSRNLMKQINRVFLSNNRI